MGSHLDFILWHGTKRGVISRAEIRKLNGNISAGWMVFTLREPDKRRLYCRMKRFGHWRSLRNVDAIFHPCSEYSRDQPQPSILLNQCKAKIYNRITIKSSLYIHY